MLTRIDYATQQAAEARRRATECTDARTREEWQRAAGMWDQLAKQYQLLLRMSEQAKL
jgi:hypothetical protein